MTNAELIAKIKAEIEILKDEYTDIAIDSHYGTINANHVVDDLEQLLSFLSTLESETTYDTQQYTPRPSVGIEDVARVQFASHVKAFDKKRKAVFDWEQFKEVAGIFYGFGKKDSSSTLESEKPMNLEEEINRYLREECSDDDEPSISEIAHHFYDLGCTRTAEKYDEIEYNRQRASGSSEIPKDLEEAANKFAVFYDQGTCDGIVQDCFKAGAKWQAEQDQETIELAEDHAYLAGAVNEREKMMKKAVEVRVQTSPLNGPLGISAYCCNFPSKHPFYHCKEGDKVKIIIVKEDEK